MLQVYKTHIKNQFPELLDKPFLLACSGGVDSVVLAHLCNQLELNFSIAHCNFKLRGDESDKDEDFVRQLAGNLGNKYFVTHFNTNAYATKHKVSMQMAARTLRYQWFSELMLENDFKAVVTAHHADDSLETFLINLSRGTGIEGLIGIPAKTDTISRPLLPFSRIQIEAFAKENNIEWREDGSNTDTKYLRNKIRHQIVPLMKELHPTFLDNFKHTTEYLKHTSILSQKHIDVTKEQLFEKAGSIIKIDLKEIEKLTSLKSYLYPLFNEYGFTEWDDVEGLLTAMTGKEVRSKTHRLLKDRNQLLLQPIQAEKTIFFEIGEREKEIKVPIHLRFSQVEKVQRLDSKNIIYVDKDLLIFPLTARKWQKGDEFHPFGLKGKKKLSKYFKDEKMDVFSKESQFLLCSENKIIWVIGKRADGRFAVTDSTKSILKIESK